MKGTKKKSQVARNKKLRALCKKYVLLGYFPTISFR